MNRYNLPRTYSLPQFTDPFEKYNMTDDYIYECIDEISKQLKGFDFNTKEYTEYEDSIQNIIEKDYPKLDEFIKGYGVGVFGFLAQFRNEIKKRILN